MRILYRKLKMKHLLKFLPLVFILVSCMKWDYSEQVEDFEASGNGLFIINEGNFQYGNATLSYYNPDSKEVINEVFLRANGMKLGDVAQSMTFFDNKGWIVVNNSHVIFAIDTRNFREIGRIENLTSPRYIQFINEQKAYVSQLWDNRIWIINPQKYEVTGYITVPGMEMGTGSTEQMVLIDDYVYCICWSNQNTILKIDKDNDEIVEVLKVGRQPNSLVADKYSRLWIICEGRMNDESGIEAPSLYRISSDSFSIEKVFQFRKDATPSEIQINGGGDTIYWLNDAVWKMSVISDRLPVEPFIESKNTKFYGLTVDPTEGDVYVADAIDYQQPGMVYRYSSSGEFIDEFYTGVTPGAFCWQK